MEYVDYVKRKVDSVLAQIHAVECVDFPYEDPRRALAALRSAIDVRLKELHEAVREGDPAEIGSVCKDINYKIAEFHPILGFLLRATNIRNQFEIFGPIRDLAHRLLDFSPGLILSSEWEFSPYTFPFVSEDLWDFVFIGLPASEASNALILPLAGHELGHSIWRRGGVSVETKAAINGAAAERFMADRNELESVFGKFDTFEDLLDDPTVLNVLALSCKIAMRQCEESFCDAIGVRLFGEAFIHSFEYLLIPSLGWERMELYPPLSKRVSDMIEAARLFGYKLRYDHEWPILEGERTLPVDEKFAVRAADDAAKSLTTRILEKADAYCRSKGVLSVDMEVADRIASGFDEYFPGQDARYIGNIVSAGWLRYREFQNFAVEIEDRDRAFDILNNLVFKSVEVLEYETKVAG